MRKRQNIFYKSMQPDHAHPAGEDASVASCAFPARANAVQVKPYHPDVTRVTYGPPSTASQHVSMMVDNFYPHVVPARKKDLRGTPTPSKRITAVYAFVQRPDDGHILLVCEKPRSFHKSINPEVPGMIWSLPGGKIDSVRAGSRFGETKQQALRREAREETGLELEVVQELYQVRRDNPHDGNGVRFDATVYACREVGGTLLTDGAGDGAELGGDQQVLAAEYLSPPDVLTLLRHNPDPTCLEAVAQFILSGQFIHKKWRYCHRDPANDAQAAENNVGGATLMRLVP